MRRAARRATSSTRESRGGGVGEHAGDERAQPALVLARRLRLRGRGGDERSDAAPRLDDAGALELGVDARDGVGVDAEVDRQLADGRQLVAGPQAAGGDRGAQAALELRVDRRGIAWVDGDDAHLHYNTSSLVQHSQASSGKACTAQGTWLTTHGPGRLRRSACPERSHLAAAAVDRTSVAAPVDRTC